MSDKPAEQLKHLDSIDSNPEDFVEPLIEKIGSLKIEKIDLSTVDGAEAAIIQMNSLQEQISRYQNQVKALKAILEQKKTDLDGH